VKKECKLEVADVSANVSENSWERGEEGVQVGSRKDNVAEQRAVVWERGEEGVQVGSLAAVPGCKANAPGNVVKKECKLEAAPRSRPGNVVKKECKLEACGRLPRSGPGT